MAHINVFQHSPENRLDFKIEYVPANYYSYKHGPQAIIKIKLGYEEAIWAFLRDLCIAGLTEARDEIDRYLAQVEQIEKQKEVDAVEVVEAV